MTFSAYFFLLLVAVLSMDAFAAGLSYGMERVRVPSLSVFTIALLSGGMLTASLEAGDFFLTLAPAALTKGISFSILFLLSLYKFYDALPWLHKKDDGLTTGSISRRVNKKDKEVLSCQEAAFLAIALSIDNISAGLCTGTVSLPLMALLASTTGIHFLSISLGLFIGRALSWKCRHSFVWLGAAVLMLMAFLRLF